MRVIIFSPFCSPSSTENRSLINAYIANGGVVAMTDSDIIIDLLLFINIPKNHKEAFLLNARNKEKAATAKNITSEISSIFYASIC
jgi:hypothetical protein